MKNSAIANARTLRMLIHDAKVHGDLSELNAVLYTNDAATISEKEIEGTEDEIYAIVVDNLEKAGVTIYG